jgi:hypothetical protein
MEELSIVRIVQLHTPDRHFDGSVGAKRAPKLGDIGTVVHKTGDLHIVESVNRDGFTEWLADFSSDELEEVE